MRTQMQQWTSGCNGEAVQAALKAARKRSDDLVRRSRSNDKSVVRRCDRVGPRASILAAMFSEKQRFGAPAIPTLMSSR